jgi:hypothetical protein
MSDNAEKKYLCPYHGNNYKPTECVCCEYALKKDNAEKKELELLPCPFCGMGVGEICIGVPNHTAKYYIYCKYCFFDFGRNDIYELIEAWNTRKD